MSIKRFISFSFIICIIAFTIISCNDSIVELKKLEQSLSSFTALNITSIARKYIEKNLVRGKKIEFLGLNNDFQKRLNVSDFSVNAFLYLAERAVKIDVRARNDSTNPLPIPIDSDSLSLLVDELKIYQPSIPMSLRIYHDIDKHNTPTFNTDPEGSLLSADIGMEFGIFSEDEIEPEIVLSFDLNVHLKFQFITVANKFSLGLKFVTVKDIVMHHDDLNVNQDKLSMTLANFINVAYDEVDAKMTNVDVLKILNDFLGTSFSKFDIMMDYGYIIMMMG